MADYLICGNGRLEADKLKVRTGPNTESTYLLFESAYLIIQKVNRCGVLFILKKHSHDEQYDLLAVCDANADEGEIYPVSILNEQSKIYAEASTEEKRAIKKEVISLLLRKMISTDSVIY